MVERWDQFRLSGDRAPVRLLKVLLIFFVVCLIWEIVRLNLNAGIKTQWPWRFTILDTSTCATLAALLVGLLAARSQFAQTMMPVLSWTSYPLSSAFVPEPRRVVRLLNSGGGRAVVRLVEYRCEMRASGSEGGDIGPWMSWGDLVTFLDGVGFRRPEDVFVFHLGVGAVVPLTGKSEEGIELLTFGREAMKRVRYLDVRIQFEDALGDRHERRIRPLRDDWTRPTP